MSEWEDRTKTEDQSFHFFIKGMRVMWRLFSTEQSAMKKAVIWMIILQLMNLFFPVILNFIFNEVLSLIQTKQFSNYLWYLIGCLVTVKMIFIVLDRYGLEIPFLISALALENQWPIRAHRKLLCLSLDYHERENTGKKIAKISRGCEKLIDIVCRLRWSLLPAFIFLACNICILFALDWRLGILYLLPIFPAFYINMRGWKKHGQTWEDWHNKNEVAGGLFCQSIVNIETVHS